MATVLRMLVIWNVKGEVRWMAVLGWLKRAIDNARWFLAVRAYGFTLPFANAVAAAFWNSRRTSLASLLGKLERCTIRT